MTPGPLRRARGLFARATVALAVTASAKAVDDLLPWSVIAVGLLLVLACMGVHAAVIALNMRLVRRIADTFGLRRAWQRAASVFACAVIGATYWCAVAADGVDRQLAVSAVYLLGVATYLSWPEMRTYALRRVTAAADI